MSCGINQAGVMLVVAMVIGAVILYRLARWAYWSGYGDAPKNVLEPVRSLSTGERPTDSQTAVRGYTVKASFNYPSKATQLIELRREIARCIGGDQ